MHLWYLPAPLPSSTPFTPSCRSVSTGLVLVNLKHIRPCCLQCTSTGEDFSQLLLFWTGFYLNMFWRIFFIGIEFRVGKFFFQNFKEVAPLSSGLHCFCWEVRDFLILARTLYLVWKVPFLPTVFNIFLIFGFHHFYYLMLGYGFLCTDPPTGFWDS